ncbi:MAG: hypothetical protein R3B95_05895 [Nitrospirales bacterium]|nr:hypothetical protein [Nitrospirales bacterium]
MKIFIIQQSPDKIRCVRPQGGERHACFAGQPTMDVGHEDCALLMADHHEADGRADQRVEPLAGHTEDVCHTFVLQTLYDEFGRFHVCFPDSIFLDQCDYRCQRM